MKILAFLIVAIICLNSVFGIHIKTINNKEKDYKKLTQKAYISINTASIDELVTLPGIGEKIANRIIEYRNNNGLFKNKEDLKNVFGIGDIKYEAIKDLIIL